MNTIDDLRNSLERHTGLAPDGLGMIEQARTGVVRLRRRRRLTATAVAAIAVLLTAAAVPLINRDPATPAATRPAVPAATDQTLTIGAASGYAVTSRTAGGGRQDVIAERPGGSLPAEIIAYAPGTFTPVGLASAAPVRVGGHDAMMWPKSRPGEHDEMLIWQDPGGSWITVTQADSHAHLLALGAAVRIGAPVTARGPVGFGWIPDGYVASYASVSQGVGTATESLVFGVPDPVSGVAPDASSAPTPGTAKISILVAEQIHGKPGSELPSTFTVAGRPAWYRDGTLFVDAGVCGVQAQTSDPRVVTPDDLRKLLSQATWGSCTSEAAWVPLVS